MLSRAPRRAGHLRLEREDKSRDVRSDPQEPMSNFSVGKAHLIEVLHLFAFVADRRLSFCSDRIYEKCYAEFTDSGASVE